MRCYLKWRCDAISGGASMIKLRWYYPSPLKLHYSSNMAGKWTKTIFAGQTGSPQLAGFVPNFDHPCLIRSLHCVNPCFSIQVPPILVKYFESARIGEFLWLILCQSVGYITLSTLLCNHKKPNSQKIVLSFKLEYDQRNVLYQYFYYCKAHMTNWICRHLELKLQN